MHDTRSDIEDQLLVMDAQDGGVAALEELVHRWQKRLWKHALRLTGDYEGAWDVTQQTWLGAIKSLRKLRDPASFRAWIYKIVTHESIDWIRKKAALDKVRIGDLSDRPAREKRDVGVTELFDRLDMKRRTVLSLFYYEELTIPEISMALGIPEGTVKSRLHGARKELKKLWQRYGEPQQGGDP